MGRENVTHKRRIVFTNMNRDSRCICPLSLQLIRAYAKQRTEHRTCRFHGNQPLPMIRAGGEKLHFLMERGVMGDLPCKIHKVNWKNDMETGKFTNKKKKIKWRNREFYLMDIIPIFILIQCYSEFSFHKSFLVFLFYSYF